MSQNIPAVVMQDSLNVRQPNTLGAGNETIMEETGEADESQIINTRFSRKFEEESK